MCKQTASFFHKSQGDEQDVCFQRGTIAIILNYHCNIAADSTIHFLVQNSHLHHEHPRNLKNHIIPISQATIQTSVFLYQVPGCTVSRIQFLLLLRSTRPRSSPSCKIKNNHTTMSIWKLVINLLKHPCKSISDTSTYTINCLPSITHTNINLKYISTI